MKRINLFAIILMCLSIFNCGNSSYYEKNVSRRNSARNLITELHGFEISSEWTKVYGWNEKEAEYSDVVSLFGPRELIGTMMDDTAIYTTQDSGYYYYLVLSYTRVSPNFNNISLTKFSYSLVPNYDDMNLVSYFPVVKPRDYVVTNSYKIGIDGSISLDGDISIGAEYHAEASITYTTSDLIVSVNTNEINDSIITSNSLIINTTFAESTSDYRHATIWQTTAPIFSLSMNYICDFENPNVLYYDFWNKTLITRNIGL